MASKTQPLPDNITSRIASLHREAERYGAMAAHSTRSNAPDTALPMLEHQMKKVRGLISELEEAIHVFGSSQFEGGVEMGRAHGQAQASKP